MMKLPCKETKCILYPACINKFDIIDCNLISKYLDFYMKSFPNIKRKPRTDLLKQYPSMKNIKKVWNEIKSTFPKIIMIRIGDCMLLYQKGDGSITLL